MLAMIYSRGLLFVTGVTGCCCTWCGYCCVDKRTRHYTRTVVAMTGCTTVGMDTGNICPVSKTAAAVTIRTTPFSCPGSIVVSFCRSREVKTVYQVRDRMVRACAMGMAVKVCVEM